MIPEVIVDLDAIAGNRRELFRRPFVQNDGVCGYGVAFVAVLDSLATEARNRLRSVAVMSEYGIWRSPFRIVFAR